MFLAPMATSIAFDRVDSHLGFAVDLGGLPIWLSLATWGLAGIVYWRLDWIRNALAAIERRSIWSWDKGFDQVMFGLVRLAGGWTRTFHHGRLEIYVVITLACLALVLVTPLWAMNDWPVLPDFGGAFYEWGIVAIAAIGVVMVVFAPTRLGAIVALGVQGLAVALIFMLFGAPDLAFTQLMVETLSVVVLALVMTRLRLSADDPRPTEDLFRDGLLAVLIGAATSVVLLRVLEGAFDGRLSEFYARTSVEIAHGRNVVNVILVDYRGLDTLGEISVVMTAGIAVLALLRRQHKRGAAVPKPRRVPRKKAVAA
jgi:multicomponent Na+:H+ antiporter subunit A